MKQNRKFRKSKEVNVLVVDGETELWYLQQMQSCENIQGLSLKPELPKKKKLKDQFEFVKECMKTYTHVYWVVDLDVVLLESKINPQHLIDFHSYRNILEKAENVTVIVNTPCLEFWFLLHFKQTGKYYSNFDELKSDLVVAGLDSYEKTEKYFKSKNNGIYCSLRSKLEDAIERSSSLGNYEPTNSETGKSEMFELFKSLNIGFK